MVCGKLLKSSAFG